MTVKEVQQKLDQIAKQVADGALFESLPDELDDLIINLPRHRRTKVTVPSEKQDDEVFNILAPLVDDLNNSKLKRINQKQLKAIEQSLKSVDAQIRDQCGLTIINGLLANRVMTGEQELELLAYCLRDDVMFDHVMEPKNSAAFGRSYAMMTLSGLLYADRVGGSYIDDGLLNTIVSRVLIYTLLEHDTRGIVNQAGWVHAFAAIAAVMNQLGASTRVVRSTKLLLMAVLLERYATLGTPMITDEQESITTFLVGLVNMHQLYHRYLGIQLAHWHDQLKHANEDDMYSEAYWTRVFNFRRLTQALVLRESLPDDLAKEILNQD